MNSDSRYEVRGELGIGGIGIVYEAWDKQLSRLVALKRLLPLPEDEARLREANKSSVTDLLREAAILSSMQHPNIVAVFDAGADDEGCYIVMERVDGEVLKSTIDRGPLTLDDFLLVAEQTLDALVAAHHHDLLHRDIKPLNLMLRWLPSDRFQVKFLDFGLAKFSPEPSLQTEAYAGSIMGSAAYMAPEQFRHHPMDARSDLYSLGCVYYFCLSGQIPFDGATPAAIMDAHLAHHVIPIIERRSDLPAALADWLMTMIARRPEDRHQTAKDALASFRGIVESYRIQQASRPTAPEPAIPGTAPNPSSPPEEPLPAYRSWWAIAGAAALLASAITFLSLSPGASKAPDQASSGPLVNAVDTPPLALVDETDKIAAHLGKELTVRGHITRTGQSPGGIQFLNFASPHFCVLIRSNDTRYFGSESPIDRYADKTVEVTGRVERYEDQYQIAVFSPDQIRILPDTPE